MENLHYVLNFFLHLDSYLLSFVAIHGTWTYLLAGTVIFCETGLIIVAFLPGDSLLFTLGSISAMSSQPLNILILLPLLIIASIVGNYVNYKLGRAIGPRIFSMNSSWFLNKKHLEQAHQFYEKHGGKTIIMARFIPIIRTFAPFVAGISYMSTHLFNAYNISSAILWIGSLLGMGYFLGSLPIIQNNFSIVIYSIILISILPPLIAGLYQRFSHGI